MFAPHVGPRAEYDNPPACRIQTKTISFVLTLGTFDLP
jgi:hypothetical protein